MGCCFLRAGCASPPALVGNRDWGYDLHLIQAVPAQSHGLRPKAKREGAPVPVSQTPTRRFGASSRTAVATWAGDGL